MNYTTKTCNKCKKEKPANHEYFHKHKGFKDGLRQPCIECRSIKKEREPLYIGDKLAIKCTGCHTLLEATTDNFGRTKDGYLGFTARCKECVRQYQIRNREAIRKYSREYDIINKEKIKKQRKEYMEKNRERLNEYYTKWHRENKHLKKIYKQRRKAREKKVDSDFAMQQWESCKEHFKNKCAYCGESKELHQEHFIPLLKGGEYTRNNIVPACRNCNSSKHINDFFEWYPDYEHYSKKREKKILQYLNYDKDKYQQLSIL